MSARVCGTESLGARLTLDSITINSNFDGSMVVELTRRRNNGVPVSLPYQQEQRMAVIDLSQLPAPQIGCAPDFETLLAERKGRICGASSER